jgi:hypothetical protein
LAEPTVNHYDLAKGAWEIAQGNGTTPVENTGFKTMVHTDYAGTFSPFAIGGSETTPLPVSFLHFTAQAQGKMAVLDWTTTMEVNNSHFEVERSQDGTQWDAIGRVQGAGNSHKNTDYQFVDPQPQALNYYRLRQVDWNGAFSFSSERMLQMPLAKEGGFMLKVYPIPAEGIFYIEPLVTERIQVSLYDMQGRCVKQLELGGGRTQVEGLSSGVYLLRSSTNNQQFTTKITVQ